MIGIVVVSHSPSLAEAAVALALEMVPRGAPPVLVAAGAGTDSEGTPVTGTDATRVAAAIDQLADADGVLVLMDLGSAVLSAELALEFTTSTVPVRLSSAPFVEGLLAAVVRAAGGSTLDEAAEEAEGALAAKRTQLAATETSGAHPLAAGEAGPVVARDTRLRNPLGLHARPAALLATSAGAAQVRIRLPRTGADASAASPTQLVALGSRGGDLLELSATGPDADAVLAQIATLIESGFGELDAPTSTSTRTPSVAPGHPLGVSAGRAVGPIAHLAPPLERPAPGSPVPDRDAEAARLHEAADAVVARFTAQSAAASGPAREILAATALWAKDPALLEPAAASIASSGTRAEEALWTAADLLLNQLAAAGGRTAERVTDLRGVRDAILARLLGVPAPGLPDRAEPYVLVARDLAPADTADLDPALCRALVTEEGGPTSHTAIIARSLGIPAVVSAAGALEYPEGTMLLVDGGTGELVVDPDATMISAIGPRPEAVPFSGSGATADAHPVELLANVGRPDDAVVAAAARAQGVGLFRTEFCFLDRTEAPTVEEQVAAYRGVLAAFPDRKVVVRTLDAGADKPLPFVTAAAEENPALGVRGLRTARRRGQVLTDQLTAIAQAAELETARVQVMAPMVATVAEAREFVALCRAAGIAEAGIMIETPAAALSAAALFEVVDFVSIGTNDLAQYTMAADRLLGELADLNDPWQPAVLELVGLVGAAGATAGKPVGVCGEAASDPALAPVLVGLGVTSLSMNARALGPVAARLAEVSLDSCRRAARAALAQTSPDAARAAAAAVLAT